MATRHRRVDGITCLHGQIKSVKIAIGPISGAEYVNHSIENAPKPALHPHAPYALLFEACLLGPGAVFLEYNLL